MFSIYDKEYFITEPRVVCVIEEIVIIQLFSV